MSRMSLRRLTHLVFAGSGPSARLRFESIRELPDQLGGWEHPG